MSDLESILEKGSEEAIQTQYVRQFLTAAKDLGELADDLVGQQVLLRLRGALDKFGYLNRIEGEMMCCVPGATLLASYLTNPGMDRMGRSRLHYAQYLLGLSVEDLLKEIRVAESTARAWGEKEGWMFSMVMVETARREIEKAG